MSRLVTRLLTRPLSRPPRGSVGWVLWREPKISGLTRNLPVEGQGMNTRHHKKGARAAASAIERCGPLRSPLFRWMVANYAALAGAAATRPIRWAEVAEVVRGLGLTDMRGQLPSEATLRQTWYRARIELRRRHSSAKHVHQDVPAPLPPMRLATPQSARPVASAKSTDPALQSPPPSSSLARETEAEAEARVQSTMARMRRHFDEASGRTPPERK